MSYEFPQKGSLNYFTIMEELNAKFEKAFSKTGVIAVSPYQTQWTTGY